MTDGPTAWRRVRVTVLAIAFAAATARPPLAVADGQAPARTDPYGDPLPEGALLRFGTPRYRCWLPNDAALSPDGKTLATAAPGVVALWDVATGRPLHSVGGMWIPTEFFANQTFLRFSPDGKRLAALGTTFDYSKGGHGPAVHLLDVATGKEVFRFELPCERTREPALAARYVWFSPGGGEIGVFLQGGVAYFLDPSTGRETRRWDAGRPLRKASPGIAPSPDGRLVVVADSKTEKSLLLLDAATGRLVRRLATPAKPEVLAFSPDSATLAVADDGPVVRLYDVATGSERASFHAAVPSVERSLQGILALAFSPDGKTLYAGSRPGHILRWRLPTAEAAAPLSGKAADVASVRSAAVTGIFPAPDGQSVVSVGWKDGLIRRWDTATGKEIPPPDGFVGCVCSRLSPGGRLLAVGDYAGKLALFDAATARPVRVLRSEGPMVTCLAWSPDAKTLAAGLGDDTAALWDVDSGREARVVRLPHSGDPRSVDSLALGPDGRLLLVSHRGLSLWDAATGRQEWSRKSLATAVLSPDGKTVATRGEHGELVLLETANGTTRAAHSVNGDAPGVPFAGAVAFSPDGSRVATADLDQQMRVTDPKTGEIRSTFRAFFFGLTLALVAPPLSLSPDGKWVLGGDSHFGLRLWEVSTGRELSQRQGLGVYASAEFGPDLRTAFAAAPGATVLVCDLLPPGGPRPGPPAALWADLASRDGPTVYRATRTLWDQPTAAVALLREKLPLSKVDEKRVGQLMAALDDDAFAERERAQRELADLGAPVLPPLKKLDTGGGSPEVRRRLRDIFEALALREEPQPRWSRAVQVLELAATAEARQLLRDWAAGARTLALAGEARAALERLELADRLRRPTDKP
jgi:WD40 repeat protein